MSIKQFIQEEILRPRIRRANILVVYDPARRYRELCREMADDGLLVVDATESSLKQRWISIKSDGGLMHKSLSRHDHSGEVEQPFPEICGN